MGPIVKECTDDYKDKSVTFVTFDFTSDETTKAAEAKAAAMGITDIYKKYEKKTGFVLLYDTEAKKEVGKLSARDDKKAWHAAIDKGLAKGA